MKMNAKKLALVLLALLLALSCLFVACGGSNGNDNNNDQQSNGGSDQKTALTKEEANQIAAKFKEAYEAEYLDLYITDVANELRAAEDTAILKITASATYEEAEGYVKEYLALLRDANKNRTFVNEVKDLLAETADVALADEENIDLMKKFDTRLMNALAGASAAQKELIDAYIADVQPLVKAADARVRALKVAKLAANAPGGLNEKIAEMLAHVQEAVAVTVDGEMEGLGDKNLTFKDFEDMVALQAAVDKFAVLHDLDADTEAYSDVLDTANLEEALGIFDDKTRDNIQIKTAKEVVEAAKALAQAACAACVSGDTVILDANNEYVVTADNDGPYYFILSEKFEAATVEEPEDTTGMIQVTFGDTTKWVARADVYADLTLFWDELNRTKVYEVTISGDANGTSSLYVIEVPAAEDDLGATAGLVDYKLDINMQNVAEDAAAKATAWANLIAQAGNAALEETVANTFYYQVIKDILAQYNASLARSLAAYREFADLIVIMNYVDTYPAKAATFDEYILTTDTQTVPANDDHSQKWKATLFDEIAALLQTIDKDYVYAALELLDNDIYWALAEYPDSDYEQEYPVFLHDNGDGTYTPTLYYMVYTYQWLVDNLAKTEKEVVTAYNTKELAVALANVEEYFFGANVQVNYYTLAQAFLAWVEKYIPAPLPADTFDLAPFKTVQTAKIEAETDFVEFGEVVLTFADDKLEEEALEAATSINGVAVTANPTEALDVTVYADYNVALAIVAKYDALVAAKDAALAALRAAVEELFKPGEADKIAAVRALYNTTVAQYSADLFADAAEVYDYAWPIIEGAVYLQERALALYPKAEWDAALAELKGAYEAALADAADFDALIARYDAIIANAQEYLEYCKAGYTVGWYSADRTYTKEMRLITQDELDDAQRIYDVLNAWKQIFTDYEGFLVENAKRQGITTPNVAANPAALDLDAEDLAATINAYVDDQTLTSVMVLILKGDGEEIEAGIDQTVFAAHLAEAKAEYETARDTFAASFALDAEKAYTIDIAKLNALIGAYLGEDGLVLIDTEGLNLADFLADNEAEYLNLSVTNKYTGAAIDLFSQIFNERILAGYCRSIALTRNYVALVNNGNTSPVDDINPGLAGLFNETTWVEYAINKLAAEVTSTETFTKFADGVAAYTAALKSININYEWAIKTIDGDLADLTEYLTETSVIAPNPELYPEP